MTATKFDLSLKYFRNAAYLSVSSPIRSRASKKRDLSKDWLYRSTSLSSLEDRNLFHLNLTTNMELYMEQYVKCMSIKIN